MPLLSLTSVEPTECFIGTERDPRQVVRVVLRRQLTEPGEVEVAGPGLHGRAELPVGDGDLTVDVPVEIDARHVTGTRLSAVVRAHSSRTDALPSVRRSCEITVAEPGWTMYLVSHFHYDPVWWNTQAAYTQFWDLQADDGRTRPVWQHNGFDLVLAHLALAERDPDYTFVLAEVDYLKPFWDTHPEARQTIRELVAAGRVEIMGGTYNEPNTNLTGPETTIRNFVYGVGYQRSVIGADPQTAWQLDVFGHDPQFPGMAADAGLTSSAWARGPHHQWGPILSTFREVGGDVRNMQFPAEFEWLSPSGQGVLTHYMPNHYSAGWWMDSSVTLAEAEQKVYELYLAMKPVASTKNLLLPVGTDYTPPNKWVTAIHRDWNERYVWPRFVCANPRDFFAAVRAEAAAADIRPSPQSRDMNPLYTGKDVSFIDTKQAQRAGEVAALDAEKLAAFADLLGLGEWPERALDKVWRQLAYGAHHDAITGSESDQVYIDLLSGWREAHDIAADIRDRSLVALLGAVDTTGAGRPLVVVNTLGFARSDLARVTVPCPDPTTLRVYDDSGQPVPHLVEASGPGEAVVVFLARDVPSLGWRTWRLGEGEPVTDLGWRSEPVRPIANDFYRVTAAPAQGGGLSSIVELGTGRELVRDGAVANELRAYDEYSAHPEFGEGPWHLLPTGVVASSADHAATSVRVERCALGERLVVTGEFQDVRYEQRVTVWHGLDRVDLRTRLDHQGADRLVRVKFPCPVPGARPVSEVAGAVIARGYAFPESDTATAPWTLDNPANNFVALSNTCRLRVRAVDGQPVGDYAIAVAEIVVPDVASAAPLARDLVRALARVGITATVSSAGGARSGWLTVDSNLPDIRIVLGGPELNPFARTLIEAAGPQHAGELVRALAGPGSLRLLVPGATPIESAWVPNADLRGPRAIPALLVATADRAGLDSEIAELVAEVAEGALSVMCVDHSALTLLEDYTVGLLSYGTPGFAVDAEGSLHLSLLRSCTGWPSGVWLDPPVRRAPDGSAFQLQHWTHDFDYALVAGPGDWRERDLVAKGHEHSTPLLPREVTAHTGDLAPTQSLMSVEPARQVQLQAVKVAGNPSARGESAPGGRALTVRLTETLGRSAEAMVASVVELAGAHRSDLLESAKRQSAYAGGRVVTTLAGAEIATVVATPVGGSRSPAGAAAGPVLGLSREIAQPVFSRYWLHNRGPAPMGFLPLSVSLSPTAIRPVDGVADVTVVVASQWTDAEFAGVLDVSVPPGWESEPSSRPVHLAAGGHTAFPLRVRLPADAAPGLYFVRAQLPGPGGDLVEDVLSIVVPGGPVDEAIPTALRGPELAPELQMHGTVAETARPTGLEVHAMSDAVELTPGCMAAVDFRLANHAAGDVEGELMLVSPWGSWALVDQAVRGFSVPAGATVDLRVDLRAPIGSEAGTTWLMAKFMWFGRVHYSPAVAVEVKGP